MQKPYSQKSSTYFLWDYNLTNKQVKRTLAGNDELKKRWLAARILESAKFSDVWEYLTLKQVKQLFPDLKLKKSVKKAWERALDAWS